MIKYELIEAYVNDLKQNILNENISISNRKKNQYFLRKIGWTHKVVIDYLRDNLCSRDYIDGPKDDYDGSNGSIWVFGKIINIDNKDYEVYIKIKDDITIKCLSFHEAEHTLVYPLKEGIR